MPAYATSDLPHLTATTAAREATPVEVAHPSKQFDLASTVPQRRNSFAGTPKATAEQDGNDYFTKAGMKSPIIRSRSHELRSGMVSPAPLEPAKSDNKAVTDFKIGGPQKQFDINTDLLVSKSPFFAAMKKPEILTTTNASSNAQLRGPFVYEQLDEFAFKLFVGWMYNGKLEGPTDFHSLHHYLGLYIIAMKFQIEALKNLVMDLVRHYYRAEEMTAPGFRVEFIYTNTKEPNKMRTFLVSTAAYRALCGDENAENTGKGITSSMKQVLKKGGDVAPDYAEALVYLTKNGLPDARVGDDCYWHEHEATPVCEPAPSPEPYEPHGYEAKPDEEGDV